MLSNITSKANATVYWNLPLRMREARNADFEANEWAMESTLPLWTSMLADEEIEQGMMDSSKQFGKKQKYK